MTEYVVVDAFPVDSTPTKALLIQKDRPDYLKGIFNMPGGKLEAGEEPISCALRELKEEAGLVSLEEFDGLVYYPPEHCGMVLGTRVVIHCIKVPVSIRQELSPREVETEPVAWFDYVDALNHPNLMPNLRVVLPLMRQAGARGWEVIVGDSDWHNEDHKVQVIFPNTDEAPPLYVTVKGLGYFK